MTTAFAKWDERTQELAADEVTVGLEAAERDELLGRVRADDFEVFEFAAAAISLAGLGELEAPPAHLVLRLASDSPAHLAREPKRGRGASRGPVLIAFSGWLAAAGLLLAFVLRGGGEVPSPDTRRAALLAEAGDLVEVAWAESETPWGAGVKGDVVWSADRQEGYMRFRGLAANDAGERQYQLWVFDPERAEWQDEPVDGGVFDVPAGAEEVVIPIDSKLRVGKPALFAVTLEEPGGVVVSKRERMVVTAAL